MTKKLHVGNLSFDTTKEQIQELFSQAGQVTEITLVNDRDSGRPKGFGFVEMATESAAQEAIKRFNGHTLDEREIVVSEARPREQRPSPPRSFDRGRRNRY
jgi:RNA recognition motif-containing protein